jgi:hypothetical protein
MKTREGARFFAACTVTLALLCGQAAVLAQQSKADFTPEDQKEIAAYTLSMDKIRKVSVASKELKEWQAKNPDLAKGAEDNDEAGTLSAKAKKFDAKYPEAAAIIKKNGLDTHEFFVSTYVFLVTSTFVGMKKSGQIKDYSAAQGQVNPANFTLVESHWDEIQKMAEDAQDKN